MAVCTVCGVGGTYVWYGVDTVQVGVLVMLDCDWIRIHAMMWW